MKMKGLLRKILVMGIVVMFLGAIASVFFRVSINVGAMGATVYVDDDNVSGPWDGTVSHPYQNITSGIDHALYGDTVYVFSGTYTENVVVNKSITLRGDSKPVIDGMDGTGIDVTLYDDFVYGVTVDSFDITNCSYGIYLVMENIANDVTDLSVTIGDIILANNTINSNSDGIFVDVHEVGVDMYGNSSVAIGDFRVTNNIINSSGKGINVDEFCDIGVYMLNSTAFSMGNIEITGNTVNSSQQGIYLHEITDLGEEMYDNSSFTMGSILVNDNTVNSNDYGIAPWFIQYFGYDLYGNSSFTMSNIEFCKNTINSTKDALGFSQFTDFGTYMEGNSSFSMGNILVNDNTIHSIIWLSGFGNFGSHLYENSSCIMGNVEFCRNVIYNDWADAITFWGLSPFGYEMYDYSLFRVGDFSVNNNFIASDGSHSGISCTEGSGGFGINVNDDAVAMTGSFEFDGNDISFTWCGLNLWKVKDAIARNNMIWNSTYGIYLPESADNTIYHNNFINNSIQAYVTPNCNNTWDDGYPSGGNYWSDYTDIDNNKGPDQDILGSDGIWDHQYVINENNTDRYPFANLYDDTPPTIEIPSRIPSGDVLPDQEVTIAVNVTDNLTGVKNVTLYYTIDDGLNWNSTEMLKNPTTGLYEAIIPGQEYGKTVRFKIEAFDYAGNKQTRDGVETYCIYQVVPEFQLPTILLAFMIATLLIVRLFRKKRILPA
jgi:parallel beta-helix repeat protein